MYVLKIKLQKPSSLALPTDESPIRGASRGSEEGFFRRVVRVARGDGDGGVAVAGECAVEYRGGWRRGRHRHRRRVREIM